MKPDYNRLKSALFSEVTMCKFVHRSLRFGGTGASNLRDEEVTTAYSSVTLATTHDIVHEPEVNIPAFTAVELQSQSLYSVRTQNSVSLRKISLLPSTSRFFSGLFPLG